MSSSCCTGTPIHPKQENLTHSSHNLHASFAPARCFMICSKRSQASFNFHCKKHWKSQRHFHSQIMEQVSQIIFNQQMMELRHYLKTIFSGYYKWALWSHWIQNAFKASAWVKLYTICKLRGCTYSRCAWTLCRSIWNVQQELTALTVSLCFPAKGIQRRVTPNPSERGTWRALHHHLGSSQLETFWYNTLIVFTAGNWLCSLPQTFENHMHVHCRSRDNTELVLHRFMNWNQLSFKSCFSGQVIQ